MPDHALTMPASTIRSGPLPGDDTAVPARQAGSRPGQREGEAAAGTTVKDVIRVATRAYSHRGVRGVRTYLHINCGCRIGSTLKGTYGTMDEARRTANELVNGTGDHYRVCSKSGLVKAQVLDRPVRHFEDTVSAAASTFNGAGVRDGDVVVVASEGVVAVVIGTAVIAITTTLGSLKALGTSARTFRDGLYAEVVDRAAAEARKIRAAVDPLHAAPAIEESEAAEPAPAAQELAPFVRRPGPAGPTPARRGRRP
ncbi:hypothetical protein ACIPPR_36580 [Streptomyces nigra]|uniref:hypothetical protein n=1 Tax=Streptomyces nigra TaxID=1827580 RepID=UPI0037F4D512